VQVARYNPLNDERRNTNSLEDNGTVALLQRFNALRLYRMLDIDSVGTLWRMCKSQNHKEHIWNALPLYRSGMPQHYMRRALIIFLRSWRLPLQSSECALQTFLSCSCSVMACRSTHGPSCWRPCSCESRPDVRTIQHSVFFFSMIVVRPMMFESWYCKEEYYYFPLFTVHTILLRTCSSDLVTDRAGLMDRSINTPNWKSSSQAGTSIILLNMLTISGNWYFCATWRRW